MRSALHNRSFPPFYLVGAGRCRIAHFQSIQIQLTTLLCAAVQRSVDESGGSEREVQYQYTEAA